MLRSNGVNVFLNQRPAPPSVALFPNDLVETRKDAVARIESNGSTADIAPETMIQFEGDELVLDHGRLSVHTMRGLRVRVGCVTITPQNLTDWTYYEVADLEGKVNVSAIQRDVYIDEHSWNTRPVKGSTSNRATVHEGEQKSRSEKCGADLKSTPTDAVNPILNSPWAIGAGVVAVGAVACFALCQNNNPISPTKP